MAFGASTNLTQYKAQQSQANTGALLAYLASQGSGDGSGDASGGGYDLNAQIQDQQQAADVAHLTQGHDAARGVISAADAQLRSRFIDLQSQQQASLAAQQAQTAQQNGYQLKAFQTATTPISADLTAQGFSAAPAQQEIALRQQAMQQAATNQQQLSQNLQAVQQRSFADRSANADLVTAGSQGALESAYAAAMANLTGSGRGGGGGGGGGGSSSGVPTAGDASSLVLANSSPFADSPVNDPSFEQQIYGAHNPKIGAAANQYLHAYLSGDSSLGLGHVNAHGGNASQLEARFANSFQQKYGKKVAPKTLSKFLGALKNERQAVQNQRKTDNKARTKKQQAQLKNQLRGY